MCWVLESSTDSPTMEKVYANYLDKNVYVPTCKTAHAVHLFPVLFSLTITSNNA